MANYRNLSPNEKNLAVSVFKQSIDFTYVFIADTFLPGNHGTAVTMMFEDRRAISGIPAAIPVHIRFWFAIFWGPDVHRNGADKGFDVSGRSLSDTLIHELTHVWQGQHGMPFKYMVDSLVAQGKAIFWYWDRNKAYEYDHNNYQKWSDYNVEQQGNIVEDWYSSRDGKQSVNDPRYTYIEKVIRPGSPKTSDIPSTGIQATAGISKSGYDPAILEVQNLLLRHGYKVKPDGFYGKQTIEAIKNFQRKHHLKDDGFAGPKTLAKLRGK